jgi:nucleoside-diphosphate-sugar epimerase
VKHLVTGAGMLGQALTARLRADGHEVVVVDRKPQADVVTVDLCDRAGIAPHLVGVDGVFHTAAVHGFREAPTLDFFEANVAATWNLCQAAADAGVRRFVHSSTVGVFGDAPSQQIDDDTVRGVAQSPYNLTKQLAEDVVAWFARTRGMHAVALRLGGFRELIERTYGELPAAWASSGGLVALADVVQAHVLAMERLPLPRPAYVVIPSGGTPLSPYHVDSTSTERDLGLRFTETYDDLVSRAGAITGPA